MSVIGIKEDKQTQAKNAGDKAYAAKGAAVATLFVQHIRDKATSMKRFLADVLALTHEGRIGFRVALGDEIKNMRRDLKAAKGTVNEAAWAKAARTYGARISEAIAFSKACDAGYRPDFDKYNYHALIGEARVFLDAESTTSPSAKRGRKPTPTLDKVKAYLEKAKLNAEECEAVAEFLQDMATPKAEALV